MAELTPHMRDKLDDFREKAISRGVPSADVDRWLALARPCALLSPEVEGPVVGHFAGPVLLPHDVPVPSAWPGMPQHLIASVDLAALPENATNLPLPADGRLLFFASPNVEGGTGTTVYIPAGATVEERQVEHPYEPGEFLADVDFEGELRGELRLQRDVCLPDYSVFRDDILVDPAAHPHREKLREVWWGVQLEHSEEMKWSSLLLDGYPTDHDGFGNPVVDCAREAADDELVSGKPEDWLFLAEWRPALTGLESATMYWAIRSQDLEARRFDRTRAVMYANP